jgi:hypothetical protein
MNPGSAVAQSYKEKDQGFAPQIHSNDMSDLPIFQFTAEDTLNSNPLL